MVTGTSSASSDPSVSIRVTQGVVTRRGAPVSGVRTRASRVAARRVLATTTSLFGGASLATPNLEETTPPFSETQTLDIRTKDERGRTSRGELSLASRTKYSLGQHGDQDRRKRHVVASDAPNLLAHGARGEAPLPDHRLWGRFNSILTAACDPPMDRETTPAPTVGYWWPPIPRASRAGATMQWVEHGTPPAALGQQKRGGLIVLSGAGVAGPAERRYRCFRARWLW